MAAVEERSGSTAAFSGEPVEESMCPSGGEVFGQFGSQGERKQVAVSRFGLLVRSAQKKV